MLDLDEETSRAVLLLAARVGAAMKKSLGCAGFNLVQNNGEDAGQTVFHFHVHVIPRYKDGAKIAAWEPQKADPEQLSRLSSSIKEAME